MTIRSAKTALHLACIAAALAAPPLSAALADAPNTANNATVDSQMDRVSNGAYDGFDKFRDATGRPLPGWEYLFFSPTD
jgi:hypothetical protein